MANMQLYTALVTLIGAMTKSEKRYFKLYSNRNSSTSGDYQFIDLFNRIDRLKDPSAEKISKAFPELSAKQLADVKRHLYDQILAALRNYNTKREGFNLKSQIANARILYEKGLYLDSLTVLNKCKEVAWKKQKHVAVFEIIDFEKEIESRHVTRSHPSRAYELEVENKVIRAIIRSEADWSEFSLKLYAKFIEKGHVKNREEHEKLEHYFQTHMPPLRPQAERKFFEQLYQFQAYEWYHFITQNFRLGFKYSQLWLELFDTYPQFKKSHPHLLIKGYHNCLSVLNNCMDIKRHNTYLEELETFVSQTPKLTTNAQLSAFVYTSVAKLNKIILDGEFTKGIPYVQQLEQELNALGEQIDDYRLMTFWFKMASIYFTMGDFRNCTRLLFRIINPNQQNMREDLQCFSRLLNLIAHFEMEDDEFLTYQIKSTYRFLLKMNDSMNLHEILIKFLRTSLFKDRAHMHDAFVDLKNQLDTLNQDPYEKRSFLYLDIISWLESKIYNQPVEHIIYQKRVTIL